MNFGNENIGSKDEVEALLLDFRKDEDDGLIGSFSLFISVCVHHVCLVIYIVLFSNELKLFSSYVMILTKY